MNHAHKEYRCRAEKTCPNHFCLYQLKICADSEAIWLECPVQAGSVKMGDPRGFSLNRKARNELSEIAYEAAIGIGSAEVWATNQEMKNRGTPI